MSHYKRVNAQSWLHWRQRYYKMNMVGKKFNKLTVISFNTNKSKKGKKYFNCKCECGTKKTVRSDSLTDGSVKSCGCFSQEFSKKTCIKKYGVDHPSKGIEVARKMAKDQNNSCILCHWKTGEGVVCVASYEKRVVRHLNKNKINFRWQSRVFIMPDGKTTYRPDLYLFSTKTWIEIKGYFRKDAEKKWKWFHRTHKNSELWNKEKLEKLGIL